MLVLINSFSAENPVKDFLKLRLLRISANLLAKCDIVLKFLVKAPEDSTAEHYDTLLEGSSDHLLFVFRFATSATSLIL